MYKILLKIEKLNDLAVPNTLQNYIAACRTLYDIVPEREQLKSRLHSNLLILSPHNSNLLNTIPTQLQFADNCVFIRTSLVTLLRNFFETVETLGQRERYLAACYYLHALSDNPALNKLLDEQYYFLQSDFSRRNFEKCCQNYFLIRNILYPELPMQPVAFPAELLIPPAESVPPVLEQSPPTPDKISPPFTFPRGTPIHLNGKKVLTYTFGEYPPKSLCFKFSPPPAPSEKQQSLNITDRNTTNGKDAFITSLLSSPRPTR